MEDQEINETEELQEFQDGNSEVITPWYLLTILKPIIREEFIAMCRYDRSGIRMKFNNGQKFHLTITEIT